MRRSYPSDISREQFSKIEPLLSSTRKVTRPRELDLYDVFCAILYLLKTACQWRMLPKDFAKWRSVHSYFQLWSEKPNDQSSLLEQALKKISRRNSC
jgi:transposase